MKKTFFTYLKSLTLPLMGAAMTFAFSTCIEDEPTFEELRESFVYDPAEVTEQISGGIFGFYMNASQLYREDRTGALSSYDFSTEDGFCVETNLYSDWEVGNPDRGQIYARNNIHATEDTIVLAPVYDLLTIGKRMYDPAAKQSAEPLPELTGQTWYGKCTVGQSGVEDVVRSIALEFQEGGRVLRTDTTFIIRTIRKQLELKDIDSYAYDWRTENGVIYLSRISGPDIGLGVAMTDRMVSERATHVDVEPLPDGTKFLFIDLGDEASLFINSWSRIPYLFGFLPEY